MNNEIPLGLFIGKVVNNYDEKHKGMVKVALAGYKEGFDTTGWMRVMSLSAGSKKGFYFLPDVGDEVIIAFINNDINNPCVIGSLWNDDTYPESSVLEKNNIKRIITKSGIQILLDEDEKKDSVKINTPKGLTVMIKDETETIEIKDGKDKNTITIDAKNSKISIKSEKALSLESKTIELKASDSVSIEGNSVTITGKNNVTVEGKSKLAANGTQVEIKAKGTLDVQSSGIATIKGSIVKING